MVYLDDILIFSKNEADHAQHIQLALEKLRKHKLETKHKKVYSDFMNFQYLGHVIKT